MDPKQLRLQRTYTSLLLCHILAQNAKITPDAPDMRNQNTVRREHTLTVVKRRILSEQQRGNTLADVDRRKLGRPQNLAELIRRRMVDRELLDDVTILIMQHRDTRGDDGAVALCSATAVVHRRIQLWAAASVSKQYARPSHVCTQNTLSEQAHHNGVQIQLRSCLPYQRRQYPPTGRTHTRCEDA